MRHGSHDDACFLPFADYRKREETKQPRGGWPTSSKRLSRRPGMSGSPALPWTTPGCGAAEARAGQAGAALHAAQAGLALRAAALDDAQAEPTRGSGPPTSDHLADAGTRPPTNATARPTSRCSRRPGRPTNGSPATPPPRPAPRPVPRIVLLAVRPCRVGCVPTLHRALDPRAQAATAPPTATPGRRVLQALKRCASRRSRR